MFFIGGAMANSVLAARGVDGAKIGLLRPITLWPFPSERVKRLANAGVRLLVAELNAGQMVEDVRLAAGGAVPVDFYGRMGGAMVTTAEMTARVRELLQGAPGGAK